MLRKKQAESTTDLPALTLHIAEWASRAHPEGTLDIIIAEAKKAGVVGALLDRLPTGSGITGDRLALVRRRLEHAEAK